MTGAGINVATFDRFSLLHFLSGAVKRRLGLSLAQSVALALLWELYEDDLKDRFPHLFPHASHDSKENALGDVLSMVAGWSVAKVPRVRRRRIARSSL